MLKQIFERRVPIIIKNSILEDAFKQKEQVIAIKDSRNLYDELEGFSQYSLKQNGRQINHNLPEDNSFVAYGDDLFKTRKSTVVKVRVNKKHRIICCIDNLVDKLSYKETVRNMLDEDFIDFVQFLNENKINYTIPKSYFKRFVELNPDSLKYTKKNEKALSNNIKEMLFSGQYKYGLLLTKNNYRAPLAYSYDINSAYPNAIKNIGLVNSVVKIDLEDLHFYKDSLFFGIIKVTKGLLKENKAPFQGLNHIKLKTIYVPKLSNKNNSEVFTNFNENNYVGLFTSLDLNYLEDAYEGLEYSILEAYSVKMSLNNNTEMLIDSMYSQKNHLKGIKKSIVKLGLNSFIGCFAPNSNNENSILKISYLFILTYVKEQLRRTINKVMEAGYEFISCDTDSIKTNMPPEEFSKIAQLGDELGQYKIEHKFVDFYQYQTKQYCGIENGELCIVCAGDPEVNQPILLKKYKNQSLNLSKGGYYGICQKSKNLVDRQLF